jgi:hypothetical protein
MGAIKILHCTLPSRKAIKESRSSIPEQKCAAAPSACRYA